MAKAKAKTKTIVRRFPRPAKKTKRGSGDSKEVILYAGLTGVALGVLNRKAKEEKEEALLAKVPVLIDGGGPEATIGIIAYLFGRKKKWGRGIALGALSVAAFRYGVTDGGKEKFTLEGAGDEEISGELDDSDE